MKTKVCTKCGVEKTLTEYGKYVYSKDGLKSRCKICISEDSKIYHKTHKQKRKLYCENNKEVIAKKRKIYNHNNKEEIKKYYIKNKKKQSERNKIRYITQSEHFKEYRENNKDKMRAQSRESISNLKDVYVKQVISKRLDLSPSEIPPELIELKRIILLIKREIKARRTA